MRYKEEKKQVTEITKKIVLTEEEHKKLIEILKASMPYMHHPIGDLYKIELRTNKGYGSYFSVEIIKDKKGDKEEDPKTLNLIMIYKQGLQKKMEEIGEERSKYRRGSLYETFLAGVEQGIFYALNYPHASITMGDVVWKSREKDRKNESQMSKEKSG